MKILWLETKDGKPQFADEVAIYVIWCSEGIKLAEWQPYHDGWWRSLAPEDDESDEMLPSARFYALAAELIPLLKQVEPPTSVACDQLSRAD